MANTASLKAEVMGIQEVLEYCVRHQLMPLILKTNFLTIKKMIDGEWVWWCRILRSGGRIDILIAHLLRKEIQQVNF